MVDVMIAQALETHSPIRSKPPTLWRDMQRDWASWNAGERIALFAIIASLLCAGSFTPWLVISA